MGFLAVFTIILYCFYKKRSTNKRQARNTIYSDNALYYHLRKKNMKVGDLETINLKTFI
jgi:hypothetical protein